MDSERYIVGISSIGATLNSYFQTLKIGLPSTNACSIILQLPSSNSIQEQNSLTPLNLRSGSSHSSLLSSFNGLQVRFGRRVAGAASPPDMGRHRFKAVQERSQSCNNTSCQISECALRSGNEIQPPLFLHLILNRTDFGFFVSH